MVVYAYIIRAFAHVEPGGHDDLKPSGCLVPRMTNALALTYEAGGHDGLKPLGCLVSPWMTKRLLDKWSVGMMA